MNIAIGLLKEMWKLFMEMAPYLLFGFGMAGLLHILIPNEKIYSHLSKNNFLAVLKATVFGIPLPLCSCGVIPVAAHLRKQGAAKGPTVAFLASTPTTGIDSLLATYGLLGLLFAVIRPVAAFFAGIIAGVLTNLSDKGTGNAITNGNNCVICETGGPHTHSLIDKMKKMFKYAYYDLVGDIGKWLMLGVVIGGAIGYFVPAEIVEKYLGNPWLAYPLMLVLGIPMYVCATGSIPIVASLIMKGMVPGAGLVFLIAGPATNTATISFVAGKLGKKSLAIYLASIAFTAVVFGIILDLVFSFSGKSMHLIHHEMSMLPHWLYVTSAIVMLGLILVSLFKKEDDEEVSNMGTIYKVPDMTCEHCKKALDASIRKVEKVSNVRINLTTKEIEVQGDFKDELVVQAIIDAGYAVEK